MDGFSGILYWLGRRLKDDERQINRWEKIRVGLEVI